jgi:hypothetical protein
MHIGVNQGGAAERRLLIDTGLGSNYLASNYRAVPGAIRANEVRRIRRHRRSGSDGSFDGDLRRAAA